MTHGIALLVAAQAALVGPQPAQKPVYGLGMAGDGDSLTVRGTSIRLFGIDAPEFDQTCTRNGTQWPCGAEAAGQLARLVTGKEVRCTPVSIDQYGRVLARCSVIGTDVNQAMVESGFAIAFRKYSTDYVAAEERAKHARRGLWAGTFNMPGDVRAFERKQDGASGGTRTIHSTPRSPVRSLGGCVIKGNRSRRGDWIYHVPGMPYYEQTRAEEMFCSEAEAQAAGFRRARAQ